MSNQNFKDQHDFIHHHSLKCDNAEKELSDIISRINVIESCNAESLADKSQDKELIDLLAENKKLIYRINVMKRAIEGFEKTSTASPGAANQKSKTPKDSTKSKTSSPNSFKPMKLEEFDMTGDHMLNIMGYIEAFFVQGVSDAFPEVPYPFNVQIQVSKVADYQCNAAMSLAKILKKNPREVGEALVKAVGQSPVIGKMEVSGPGFVNIYLNQEFIQQQITNLILKGVTAPTVKKVRVVVDFSSPNIAKEMHVGHLRSTIIGESICRLLEFLGHDVVRLNHLGDWGTQFGMLIAHLHDRFPNFLQDPPAISDLQSFYKESKKRFDEDTEFKARAYQSVVKLQSHDPEYLKAWKLICQVSIAEFEKVYERLNVRITPRGESFYQSHMMDLVKELDTKGLLSLEDGRKVMYAEGANIPLTVVKSDGGFTYDTSDMACLRHRVREEKGQWLIYVVDAGQGQHFKSLFPCALKAGLYDPSEVRLDHVTFGVVLGEDKKKFKTRSGDTIRLAELLNEGLERSEEKLREKDRQEALSPEEFQKAKQAVAYGCIKYADLSHDRTRDYIFSFDRMIDFRGNTAAYLLYALTRIRSIARNAGIERASLLSSLKSSSSLALEHEKEAKLAKTLLKMADVILKLAQDLYLHPLCEFLYEISTTFTEFYDNCYCIEKDATGKIVKTHTHRLLLCEATAIVMEKCFHILGIDTLEKM